MNIETFYMNPYSGSVATKQEWKSDFDSMDAEAWFGLPAEDCKDLHWLKDSCLLEVAKNSEGDWA